MVYDVATREHYDASETGEALTATQKSIVRLRAVKEARKLTVAQVEQMVNYAVSRTTLNRFFSAESETKYNFDYEYTILPIQRALLVEDTIETGDDVARAKVSSYEAALQQKDEVIKEIQLQVEKIRQDYERKCVEYELRIERWYHQIEKKDERMDRKDSIIAEKDIEIRQLREQIDKLTGKLLERSK